MLNSRGNEKKKLKNLHARINYESQINAWSKFETNTGAFNRENYFDLKMKMSLFDPYCVNT